MAHTGGQRPAAERNQDGVERQRGVHQFQGMPIVARRWRAQLPRIIPVDRECMVPVATAEHIIRFAIA